MPKAPPCRSVEGCTAQRHGDEDAYINARCRCPEAREAHRVGRKRRALRLITTGPVHIDGTGTARRLRALAAIGYGVHQLGPRLHIDASYLGRLRSGRGSVLRSTADAVARLYDALSDTPGPARKAALAARRAGWLEPIWWDDDTIDDPTYFPTVLPVTEAQTGPGRPRLTITDDIDPVVVERLIAADTSGTSATTGDKYAAYALLRRRGLSPTRAAEVLHLSLPARTLFAGTYEQDDDRKATA